MKTFSAVTLSTTLGAWMLLLSACSTSQPLPQPTPSPSATVSPSPMPSPTQPTAVVSEIGYGLSYGMCLGYCNHSLTITADQMRLVHTAPRDAENFPEKVIENPTPADTWERLNRLANFETLKALPDRLGCPDCADGGAEWVALQHQDERKQ